MGTKAMVQSAAVGALCLLSACQNSRVESRAPGQPTMNELMHRGAASSVELKAKSSARAEEMGQLTSSTAQLLVAKLKTTPDDSETFWTLIRYWEKLGNVPDRHALRLWYIANHPSFSAGNIDPGVDRAGYERGKALWLAHMNRPGAPADIFERSAEFLEGGDRQLAEMALDRGRKNYPSDRRWPLAYGRHYAQALLGSGEPLTEFNVFRKVNAREASSAYARSVQARLAESSDAPLLVYTAQYLMVWGSRLQRADATSRTWTLAKTYADRALSIDPGLESAKRTKVRWTEQTRTMKAFHLQELRPAEQATLNDSDRLLLLLHAARTASHHGSVESDVTKATALLSFANQHPNDPLYADAVFDAHMMLGKAALHRRDKDEAARHLLAAAATPGSERIRYLEFEMNLPRALVDWGKRTAVAEFLERMALKTARAQRLQEWATDIRKGINPDLVPTMSFPGCKEDPC